MAENTLVLDSHILVCVEIDDARFHIDENVEKEYQYLTSNFCGRVACIQDETKLNSLNLVLRAPHGVVYASGNIQLLQTSLKNSKQPVKVIEDFSFNFEELVEEGRVESVTSGEVPINLNNAGVYYRNILDPSMTGSSTSKSYFDTLQEKHKFQALTESNKPGTSFRKGVYLSEVKMDSHDAARFNLLRCSTNLDGPTVAFADVDRDILRKVNELAQLNFDRKVELNHVLAQVYENSVTVDPNSNKTKEHKAKIKSHSDKTKDMPANGLMVFCTFYSSDIAQYKPPQHDRFDRYYKGASVLTQLRFRLKEEAHDLKLAKDFRVTLYPNSVFLVPLSTNRLYTHETCPPMLPIGKFPTRLGYVVRCSKTKAVFRNGATFIKQDNTEDVKLEEPTATGIEELRKLYQEENIKIKKIEYKDIFFSLNRGDYTRPLVE